VTIWANLAKNILTHWNASFVPFFSIKLRKFWHTARLSRTNRHKSYQVWKQSGFLGPPCIYLFYAVILCLASSSLHCIQSVVIYLNLMFSVGRGAESCSLLDETLRENSHNLPLWRIAVTTSFARAVVSMATDRRVNYTTINQSPLVVAEACVVIGEMFARRWLANRLESIHVAASNFRFVQSASSYVLTVNVDSNTVFTLYRRFYNRLCELCKWAQPSGAWAVQPGRSYLFNYLLSLILRDGKIRSITKLYCIYLFIYLLYEYSQRLVVQPVLQPRLQS